MAHAWGTAYLLLALWRPFRQRREGLFLVPFNAEGVTDHSPGFASRASRARRTPGRRPTRPWRSRPSVALNRRRFETATRRGYSQLCRVERRRVLGDWPPVVAVSASAACWTRCGLDRRRMCVDFPGYASARCAHRGEPWAKICNAFSVENGWEHFDRDSRRRPASPHQSPEKNASQRCPLGHLRRT